MKLKILWIYLLGLGTLTLSAQVIPNIYQLIDSVHQRIQTPNTEWLQRKIYDNGITLLKNQQERLPLKVWTKHASHPWHWVPYFQPVPAISEKYGEVASFQASTAEEMLAINELKAYDLLIVSLHASQSPDVSILQQLAQDTPTILVFFTPPYAMDPYKPVINAADAVIMAYDTTSFAQMSAAQGIFGGISFCGKLPVTTASFPEGSGLTTQKTRLSYSQPEEVGIPSERLSGIEPIALEGIRQRAYPGCQILVAKDGVIIYEREFGHFDYSQSPEVTDGTVYDLASMTKASATLPAIMKLYDEKNSTAGSHRQVCARNKGKRQGKDLRALTPPA